MGKISGHFVGPLLCIEVIRYLAMFGRNDGHYEYRISPCVGNVAELLLLYSAFALLQKFLPRPDDYHLVVFGTTGCQHI